MRTMEGVRVGDASFSPIDSVVPFVAHAGARCRGFRCGAHRREQQDEDRDRAGRLLSSGGIAAGIILQAPPWYDAVDFIFAYIPMAWIGAKLAERATRSH